MKIITTTTATVMLRTVCTTPILKATYKAISAAQKKKGVRCAYRLDSNQMQPVQTVQEETSLYQSILLDISQQQNRSRGKYRQVDSSNKQLNQGCVCMCVRVFLQIIIKLIYVFRESQKLAGGGGGSNAVNSNNIRSCGIPFR